ncbi:cobalt-precorrin 5A hydrolase [Candidatus Acidulodesulfobacterium sp. H_13]|uniref:cobalt-precorrin 5A hydrolase n=1 Tax=Candidatus Acidulodesulfobacterium sp. H_13 TaxID=3395470 RepID=UPI003AF87DA3
MIRIFHTASGIKKTEHDSAFEVKNIAFIIISKNSLKTALDIYKGIAEKVSSEIEIGTSEILYLTFFIEKNKNELIETAKKYLSELIPVPKSTVSNEKNISIKNYEKLSINFLGGLFKDFDHIVFFLALGATVRYIAPLIKDKLSDPGVIVIDESGKFVISVLSGHTGGANEFTERISGFLGAIPVVTTATDRTNRFSIDMFAKRFGFFIESARDKIKVFNKASLKGEKFKIYIENDFNVKEIKNYIDKFNNSKDFSYTNNLDLDPSKIIAISVNENLKKPVPAGIAVILRPKRLVVGIGCNKNTDFEEIEDFILSKFADNNLSINAVRNTATIDLKMEEEGILRFGKNYGGFVDFFTKKEINDFIEGFNRKRNENSLCFKHTGAYSVCEPCAALSAKGGGGKGGILLIPKQKKGNVTMAVTMADNLK